MALLGAGERHGRQGDRLGLDRDCGELVGRAREAGLLINVTQGNIVRLLPPLNLSNQEADELVSKLTQLLNR